MCNLNFKSFLMVTFRISEKRFENSSSAEIYSLECSWTSDLAHFSHSFLSFVKSNSPLLHAAQSVWCEIWVKESAKTFHLFIYSTLLAHAHLHGFVTISFIQVWYALSDKRGMQSNRHTVPPPGGWNGRRVCASVTSAIQQCGQKGAPCDVDVFDGRYD